MNAQIPSLPPSVSPPIPRTRDGGRWRAEKFLRALRVFAIYFLLFALLYFALRNAPLTEIWSALQKLKPWQILLVLGINIFIYFCMSARWWLIVHAEDKRVKYLSLVPVRLSAFGVSYFTLGPQVGGEPLQVLYLRQKYGLTFTRATASVIMDKLLEFLASFILLAFGLTALLQAGFFSRNGSLPLFSMIGLVVLLALPFVYIFLLIRGKYPLTSFLRALPFVSQSSKAVRFVSACEWMAGTFCRRHVSALLLAIAVSLLAAAAMVSEYFLIVAFLEIHLPFWSMVSAWATGWLSFLVPLPGGVGALEASQVFALGRFGIMPASAVSVVLLMRGRDLVIGGLGLLFAGRAAARR